MQNPQYNNKQLISISLVLLAIIIFALITSFIWIPLLILSCPLIIFILILSKYTKVGGLLNQVYYNFYDWLFYKSEAPRKFMWSLIYNTMCLLYPQTQWKSMNYGYATLQDDGILINNLKNEDEDERYCLQLYHYMVSQQNTVKNLSGLKVLEVGSGRGGGLEYISKYLNPEKCVGVDYSENQVAFCKSQYANNKKLTFFQGDSEKLDQIQELEPNAFDIAINVESSHCYGNFDQFVNQVCKLLKPNGVFCFTDFRTVAEAQILHDYFQNHPQLDIVKHEDITVNILQSLKQDEKRRNQLIQKNVFFLFRPFFAKFSGLQGTRINTEFAKRETIYVAYFLKKKDN